LIRLGNFSIWASAQAPDQVWERGGWTFVDGDWAPPADCDGVASPQTDEEVQRLIAQAFTGRRADKAKALYHLHYFTKFFGKDELELLVNSSNQRLAYERESWRAHEEGRGQWTYKGLGS